MSDINDLKLPKHIAGPLLEMVDIAEENQLLTLLLRRLITSTAYTVDLGETKKQVAIEKEDFLLGLQAMGFLSLVEDGRQLGAISVKVFLTEKAYKWAYYQRQGAIGSGWSQAVAWGKQVAPLFVTIAAVVLVILQILQILGIV